MIMLGIETSCDETGLAIVKAEGGFENPRFRVLKNLVASQIKIHAPFGGVVPALAKRAHQKNLPLLLNKLGGESHVLKNTHAIAVTTGPGLEPCLWQGIEFAKKLAGKHKKPLVGVNHMEGHIASVLLKTESDKLKTHLKFPAVALLVSGGHTELVLIKNWLNYKIIGQTLDDAAGEAFDKVARLLGLPYPGGPLLSVLADKKTKRSVSGKIRLPRPMINSKDLNFSFSGLKTAVLYALRGNPKISKSELAKEFQNAAVEVLGAKTLKALAKFKPKTLIVAGGVSANKCLREELKNKIKILDFKLNLLFPEKDFTGDNAAMIAAAGYFRAIKKYFSAAEKMKAEGRLSIEAKKR